MIDAHIHLDWYEAKDRMEMIQNLATAQVDMLITVSSDEASSRKNAQFALADPRIKPAFGFHPEQPLPGKKEIDRLFAFIEEQAGEMVTIGEVGLPYYLRQTVPHLDQSLYIDLLERFIRLASKLAKPIILHAVYDDAPLVCDLLEQYAIEKAHFHWFKGDSETIARILGQDWVISVTPEVCYREKIQTIVKQIPITQLLVETDGPWQFAGPYKGKVTHPHMLHDAILQIARLKNITIEDAYRTIYKNTIQFYQLS